MKSNACTPVRIFKDTKRNLQPVRKFCFCLYCCWYHLAGLPATCYFYFLSHEKYNNQLFFLPPRIRPPLSSFLLQTVKTILEIPKDDKQAEEIIQLQGRWVTYFPTGQCILSASPLKISPQVICSQIFPAQSHLFPFSKSEFTASLFCYFRIVCSLCSK